MARTTCSILLRAAFGLAVILGWAPSASIGQTVCPAASVSPTTAAAGTSPTLTVTTNGTVDLGNVTTKQFGIKPSAFASNYKIISQFAQELTFSMDIARSAQPGLWTLFVNDASGHEVVALNFNITAAAPPPPRTCNPPCAATLVCSNGECVEPGCLECARRGLGCFRGTCVPPQ